MRHLLIFVGFLCTFQSLAQEITLVRMDGSVIENSHTFDVEITYDSDSSVQFALKDSKIHIDSSLCKEIVKIRISIPIGQSFYNEYLCGQIQNTDTIIVNQTHEIRSQTPRLYLGGDLEETVFNDQFWIGEWLAEHPDLAKGILFKVYNTDRLSSKNKRKIRKYITEYCNRIGRPEFANRVETVGKPYTTGQQDDFNEGTVVTRQFIKSQNTNSMKRIAEKYSLVVVVDIDWNRS